MTTEKASSGYIPTLPAQPGEIAACIENILSSAMTQAAIAERNRVAGKAFKKPDPAACRRVLEKDLAARGWALAEVAK